MLADWISWWIIASTTYEHCVAVSPGFAPSSVRLSGLDRMPIQVPSASEDNGSTAEASALSAAPVHYRHPQEQGGRSVKILVAYFSETGNTKRIATSIGEEAKALAHKVRVASIGDVDVDVLPSFEIVFLGSTCHSSDIAAPAKEFLARIPAGSALRLAGFVTHSTMMPEGTAWKKEMHERWAGRCPGSFEDACREKGIEFLGFFSCQGAPSPEIETFIRNSVIPDEKQWITYIEDARRHPTPEDLEAARSFARNVLAVCKP